MIAYCGLDCSQCDGYLASQSGDLKKIEAVAQKWSVQFNADVKAEHIWCDGCTANGRQSYHCSTLCQIRQCCLKKGYGSCGECKDFACELLDPIFNAVPEAKKNLLGMKK